MEKFKVEKPKKCYYVERLDFIEEKNQKLNAKFICLDINKKSPDDGRVAMAFFIPLKGSNFPHPQQAQFIFEHVKPKILSDWHDPKRLKIEEINFENQIGFTV